MADDKIKRGRGAQHVGPPVCGICKPNPPQFLCPSCPRRDHGQASNDDHGWAKVIANDGELGRLLKANAKAARHLAALNPIDFAYSDWLAEYQKQGDELRELYRRRPALLGPGARHE